MGCELFRTGSMPPTQKLKTTGTSLTYGLIEKAPMRFSVITVRKFLKCYFIATMPNIQRVSVKQESGEAR